MSAVGIAPRWPMIWLLVWLAGCGPAVDPATLPDVPLVSVDKFEPAVREQLSAARTKFAQDPASAIANGELGMVYRVYQNYAAAEVAFRRARQLAPRNPDWIYYHAEALENLGDPQAALIAIEQFRAREPDDLPGQLREARLTTELGRPVDALPALAALLQKTPELGDVHIAYAQALTRVGRYDEAQQIWLSALQRFGSFRIAHYALAQLYRRAGDTQGARRQLWQFEVATVKEPPAYDPRIRKLFELNQSDRSLVRAAQVAKRSGDSKRALTILEQAIERNPANMETRAALVIGYTVESDFERAQHHATAGLAHEPDHVGLKLNVGRLYLQQGQLVEATSRFEDAVALSPKHAQAQAWLGRARDIAGDKAGAGDALRRAVSLDPKDRLARRSYADWLTANAPPADAITALAALANTPSRDAPLILSTLATLQSGAGDSAAALASLDRGIQYARWLDQPKLVTKLSNQRARLAGASS